MEDKRNGVIHRTAFIVSDSGGVCMIALGDAGIWNDGGTIKYRNAAGADAVVSSGVGGAIPIFAVATKTAAALAVCVYDNGVAGVGATLIKSTNGALGTIGGVALVAGDVGKLILVDQQAAPAQNGVYVITANAAAGAKWKLTRVAGMDAVIVDGSLVMVQAGTYADQLWEQSAAVVTVGTDTVTFGLSATTVTFASVAAALALASGSVAFNAQKLTGVLDPTAAQDAATLAFVNATTALRAGYTAYTGALAAQATAGACTIVTDVAISAVALTLAAQPDVPRKLVAIKTDADSSYAATLTIIGKGPAGEAISDVITMLAVDGTHTYTSAKAFATITSATVSALSGNTGADKIAIGLATALGLPIPATATSVVVYKEAAGATIASTPVNETVGATDTTARTVVPTTAADGTKALHFWYSYVQPVVQR